MPTSSPVSLCIASTSVSTSGISAWAPIIVLSSGTDLLYSHNNTYVAFPTSDATSCFYPSALSGSVAKEATGLLFANGSTTTFTQTLVQGATSYYTTNYGSAKGGRIEGSNASPSSPYSPLSSVATSASSTSGLISDTTAASSKASGSKKTSNESGAVAGAAVGSAFGAAVLAALVTLLCLRRRRNKRRASGDRSSVSDVVVFGKVGGSPQSSTEESGELASGLTWIKQLPQPSDDNDVAMRIRILYNNIELHVENFYKNIDVRGGDMSEDAQEALLDLDTGLLPSSLPTTLLHSPAKVSVIKHTLAHIILDNISPQDPPKTSLLPAEYVGMIQKLNKEQNSGSRPALSQSLSHYRVMTAYLWPDPTIDQTYLQQRDIKISQAATTFTTAFEPWSNHSASSLLTRKQNLVDIIRSATDTGIFLFSQPAAFTFKWELSGTEYQQEPRIVTLPAFVKVGDDRGNRLDGNGVIVQQVVEEI